MAKKPVEILIDWNQLDTYNATGGGRYTRKPITFVGIDANGRAHGFQLKPVWDGEEWVGQPKDKPIALNTFAKIQLRDADQYLFERPPSD